VGSRGRLCGGCSLHSSKALFRRFYSTMRVTRVELLGEFSVYNYTLEYVTTHLPGEFSENRMRLLEGYSTLYIQVSLATECSENQGQEYRSRQLIKGYVIII